MNLIKSDLMIMDLDKYYTWMSTKVSQWMDDPAELLYGYLWIYLQTEDKVYDSLYLSVSAKVETSTETASGKWKTICQVEDSTKWISHQEMTRQAVLKINWQLKDFLLS